MFAYQLRLSWRSLKRNPVLTLLLIGGIGLGIAVSMVFVTTYYYLAGDPIPDKSARLFNVQLDAWDPNRAWDTDDPTEPPDQLTYIDAMALMRSDIPTYKTACQKRFAPTPTASAAPKRSLASDATWIAQMQANA